MDNTKKSTGYGPSTLPLRYQWQNLIFDARHFEIWETKFLGYMKLKNLIDILIGSNEIDEDENEVAFAELIQFLDERSIALVIRDARDKGREAFKILKDHYAGTSKPRIITLYNQLTSLKKLINESITDYIVDNGNEDEINYIDYCYLMNIPTSYNNAINTDDSEKWKSAMEEEMQSLITNDTFVLTELPTNKKLVGGRWVYMIKSNSNGVMYKARYVAKGYKQIQGIDYLETFSPTARMETVRILMQISIQYDLILHQMDVKSAYLHAPIENEIYVSQPPGYEQTENNKQLVWKLNKSLYGLKQSGRNWQNVLSDFLKKIRFVQSNADACVFIKRDNNDIAMSLVWVDDIIIAANSNQLLFEVKNKLSRRFKMKDLGPLTSFLGIQFNSTNNCVTMNQSDYLQNVLHKFGFFDCKPRSTPCEQVPNSYQDQESTESSDSDIKLYRQMVGSLLYAMTCTRPDLSYVDTILSQHLSKPNSADWTMINHVF